MRTSWVMKGIKRSPAGGYLLAFDTPKGPKRLQTKVAVCTAPAHRLANVEGLRVSDSCRWLCTLSLFPRCTSCRSASHKNSKYVL